MHDDHLAVILRWLCCHSLLQYVFADVLLLMCLCNILGGYLVDTDFRWILD